MTRSEWQPIETAPKDGSLVILYNGTVEQGNFVAKVDSGRVSNQFVFTSSWDGLDGYLVSACDPQPTHWMPLPNPPEE